jgi:hypothetical protein
MIRRSERKGKYNNWLFRPRFEACTFQIEVLINSTLGSITFSEDSGFVWYATKIWSQ